MPHWNLLRKNLPGGQSYHLLYHFCFDPWICFYFKEYICIHTWENQSVAVKWCKCKRIEGNLFLVWQKNKKIDNNHFSNCSLKILNLHRKSKYQQNKNIARSVNDLGIALCSCFVDILIFYANLKFSVGHGTSTKQAF